MGGNCFRYSGKDNDWGGSFYRNIKNLTLNIDAEEIEQAKTKIVKFLMQLLRIYLLEHYQMLNFNSNIPINKVTKLK